MFWVVVLAGFWEQLWEKAFSLQLTLDGKRFIVIANNELLEFRGDWDGQKEELFGWKNCL